jgi:hypothetical protein
MGRKGFRKHAVDFVSPATVVLDNLIDDIRHGTAIPVHAGTPYHIQNGSFRFCREIKRGPSRSE